MTPAHARLLRTAALLGVLAAAVAARLVFGPLTSDDAYITLRYARNLVEGHGFVFNHGERVLGTTTPLFTLLLAAAAAVKVPFETAAFTLPLVSDLLLIAGLILVLERHGYGVAGAAAGAFIAVSPVYVTAATSGMETSLYVLLLGGAFHSWARSLATSSFWPPALWFAALAMCRPDAMAALAAAGAVGVSRRPWHTVRMLAATALLVAPWLIFATWYFGSPVPQSVLAKAALAEPFGGIDVFGQMFGRGVYFPVTVLACVGAAALWQTGSPVWRAVLLWWVLYTSAFIASGGFALFPWYFIPLLPPYIAAAGVGWTTLVSRLPARVRSRLAWTLPVLVLVYGAIRLPVQRDLLVRSWETRERTYLRIGRELADTPTPCRLAATEIGALGFTFRGRVIDLVGLVTPMALSIEPDELLHYEEAAWLVTQNILVSPRVLESEWFQREFVLVDSYTIAPGRWIQTFRKRGARCA